MSTLKLRAGEGTPFDQMMERGLPKSQEIVIPEPPRTNALVSVPTLTELAEIANAEHRSARLKGRELVEHAIRAGEALLKARALVEAGGWLTWVQGNLEIHLTTVHRYMRMAEHREIVLASEAKSIEHAIQLLADQPRRGHGPRGYSDADKAEWIKLADEIGVKPAARAVGVSPATMHAWTSPNSPSRGQTRKSREVTEDRIERVAEWLVARFGNYDYPERVNAEVRIDAARLLGVIFEIEDDE